jgi:GNAT superfamily N-acetyltransferase
MADVGVRLAIPADADELSRIQAAVWAEVHGAALPADLLEAVGSTEAADRWREAIVEPPSPRHRVLAGLAGDDVVGFAVLAPAVDPDLDPAVDGELLELCVDPAVTGAGHGSRLVNASADLARDDGFHRLYTWLAAPETRLREFLAGAGWGADGATRSLDLRGDGEVVVEQTRLRTALVDP